MKETSRLLEGISENIKEAMSASFAAAEMLQNKLPTNDKVLVESLSIIRHGQFRLLLLSEQLSDLSASLRGEDSAEFTVVELVGLCSKLTNSISALVSFTGVSLSFKPELAQLLATVDAIKLERMLTALFANAISHTPSGGFVTLRLSATEETMLFTVSDTGGGIPEEKLGTLFADYARERVLTEPASSGLGLSSVSYIASVHGGTVAASNTDTGAVFSVSIPIRRDGTVKLRSDGELYSPTACNRLLTGLSSILPYSCYTDPYI